jgi:ABC-2 type transport system ATP-binding protein
LKTAPKLAGFETLIREDGDLEVTTDKDKRLNDLFHELDQHSIKVVSLRNKSNRLEELFMGLVENKPGAAA